MQNEMRMFTVRHVKTRTKLSIVVYLCCCNSQPSVLFSLVRKRSSTHNWQNNVWIVSFCWMNRTKLPNTNHTLWFSWCSAFGRSECEKQFCVIIGSVVSLNLRCSFTIEMEIFNLIEYNFHRLRFVSCFWTWFSNTCRIIQWIGNSNEILLLHFSNDSLVRYNDDEIRNKKSEFIDFLLWIGYKYQKLIWEFWENFRDPESCSIIIIIGKTSIFMQIYNKVFTVIRTPSSRTISKKYLKMQSFISQLSCISIEKKH